MEIVLFQSKKVRIVLSIGKKGKNFAQSHFISMTKEYYDHNEEVYFAKDVFHF